MEKSTARWSLAGSTTTPHGVTHSTLWCKEVKAPDADYEELVRVLTSGFGAVAEGQLSGPGSLHKYFNVAGLRFGVSLDWPDWLDLYALEECDKPAMGAFVGQLLKALNGQEQVQSH
jgi:hypothetical protein